MDPWCWNRPKLHVAIQFPALKETSKICCSWWKQVHAWERCLQTKESWMEGFYDQTCFYSSFISWIMFLIFEQPYGVNGFNTFPGWLFPLYKVPNVKLILSKVSQMKMGTLLCAYKYPFIPQRLRLSSIHSPRLLSAPSLSIGTRVVLPNLLAQEPTLLKILVNK